MSIKQYLFILFGGLILLLGLSQLLIGEALKRQLDEELKANSVAISRQLVNILVDDLGQNLKMPPIPAVPAAPAAAPVQVTGQVNVSIKGMVDQQTESAVQTRVITKHGTTDMPSKTEIIAHQQHEIGRAIADLNRALSAQQRDVQELDVQERDTKGLAQLDAQAQAENEIVERELEKLHQMQETLTQSYQKALEESLQTMTITRQNGNADSELLVIRTLEDGRVEQNQLTLKQDSITAALTQFREWMALLILSTSLLALVFVYWLSRKVSEPLSDLATGHRKLGAGELGYKVTPRGIEEIRSMLDGFNAMSEKLAMLSAREQQVADKKHLAELGEITRGIAHSLRNPLHTLGLLAETQHHLHDEPAKSAMLEAIQQKITMMDKSIQSLLTLAATEVDRSRSVPLAAVVRDVLLELSVAGLSPLLSLRGLDDEHVIFGIESEVRSILHAVIINAVEAQQDNTPWLEIELHKDGEGLWVSVSDKGLGIDSVLLDKLGQPHITTKAEGTGMGLYIASRLLSSHYQGKLVFNRRPEGGTQVKVLFGMDETGAARP